MLMTTDTVFSHLDNTFARFLSARTQLNHRQKATFEYLVKTLSAQQNQGHNCIKLNAKQQAILLNSGVVALAEAETTALQPLVIEDNRLYLQRYWAYEQRLARQLRVMIQQSYSAPDASVLNNYFVKQDAIDWQCEAAKLALTQRLSIITGGPGTGKTTTVVKILALLQEVTDEPLLIALTAPTGKAAMRLQESVNFNKHQLRCAESIKNLIPQEVSTLHRLLGAMPASPYFRHHANKPLIYDVVVVDEASMVDLALMAKLVDALKADARLILLGDKDQLASVESGAVLADLTQALTQHTVELQHAYRFNNNIKNFASAVNQQQADDAWQQLQNAQQTIQLLPPQESIAYIAEQYSEYLTLIKTGADFTAIYRAFNKFRVLCANRQGKNSVADINYLVEQTLAHKRQITITGLWYNGRPIMVTQNNPALHLYNGDIGLCLLEQDMLIVCFQAADGSIKRYLPTRIPACETVFAMTIHKSQGSEFDHVLIALPDNINAILTKELLYTAITRAKESIKIVADKTVFMQTIQQGVERVTGLASKLNN